MTTIQEFKQPIRAYMQAHYTDQRLAELLAHAQDGKLNYLSCCCFIGVATAEHALVARLDDGNLIRGTDHYQKAKELPGAAEAEHAYCHLAEHFGCGDFARTKVLIPMIKAEMKRREWARTKPTAIPAPSVESVPVG